MEEPKKLIVIEDLKSPIIRVKIGKEKFPYLVDESDRVIPNPNIVADFSEYVRPYEDGDALYGNHKFSCKYAYLEVKGSLQIECKAGNRYTDLIESKLLRLPNIAKDAIPFLRVQCFAIDKELDECQFANEVLKYSGKYLAKEIVKDFFNIQAITGDSEGWGNFLAYCEPLVEEYNKASNLWAQLRWLQSKIAHYEQSATPAAANKTVNKQSVNNKTEELTERERALIHCYKQLPPIIYGEPLYADYMKFARPGDRTSYPNDSKRRAMSLIRSIEKIKTYLTESEIKQAESEINTIETIFRNQL